MYVKIFKKSNCFKWIYVRLIKDFIIPSLSTLYLIVSDIIIPSLKSIGQFYHDNINESKKLKTLMFSMNILTFW